ncbi:MAG TPA: amidohydrolase, partial [Gemmatimonadota bacterium]|nr:amidohydrolase [Gemmatimonadota bacterium]
MGAPPPDRVDGLLPDALRADLVALRRRLHARPELSGEERETRETIRGFLEEHGVPELRDAAGTGLVARIPGRGASGPAVALRGDIDALPIEEDTGLPFASGRPGVMHACGHDVHAAWAAGAALLLAERPAAGEVLVVFQPAEETGRGARAVLEDGALEGAAAIFGGHVDTDFEVGRLVAQPGPLAASAD